MSPSPTVEWRFRRAVLNAFQRHRGTASMVTELEPIVFEGVYPLYGLAELPRIGVDGSGDRPSRPIRPPSSASRGR